MGDILDLKGRIALVTGEGQGVGCETAGNMASGNVPNGRDPDGWAARLGLSGVVERRSYRNVKSYRRGKRWRG